LEILFTINDKDFRSIIDMNFYETFSTLTFVLHTLDTLSYIRIKALELLF